MIKGVIFDLNQVLVKSQLFSDRFQETYGITDSEFLGALDEVLSRARMPNAGDSFGYWKPYLENWGIKMSREDFFDFWFRAEKPVPDVVEMVRKLKKQELKVFVVSNNFRERVDSYKDKFEFLFDGTFDGVYFSCDTGFVKPNPMVYKKILEDSGLKAEECVYFDNLKMNVEEAEKLGIKSYIYRGPESIKKVLSLYLE